MTDYHSFGDSLSVLYSPSSGLYVNQVADNFGWSITNHAVSGSMAADQSFLCYGITPSSDSVASVEIGLNDAAHSGMDGNKLEYGFVPFHRGLVAWNALPAKVTARSTAMYYTGTWSNTSFNSIGKYTSSPSMGGDTAGCFVSGQSIYIFGAIENHPASEATVTVRVDSVNVGTIQTHGTLVGNTVLGRTYSLACWRFWGLSSGSHLVQLTLSSTTCFFLDAVAGSDQPYYPPVYVGDIHRIHPLYSYDPAIRFYNGAILSNLQGLCSDGLNIKPFYVSDVIDPVFDLSQEGVHWNESGQNNVAQALIGVASS